MSTPTGKGGFQERKHQINRKGRPRNLEGLRELALQIGHEPLVIGDKRYTVTEAILRQWASSKNPKLQQAFIEIAYGKVPDKMELSGVDGSKLQIEVIYTKEKPETS